MSRRRLAIMGTAAAFAVAAGLLLAAAVVALADGSQRWVGSLTALGLAAGAVGGAGAFAVYLVDQRRRAVSASRLQRKLAEVSKPRVAPAPVVTTPEPVTVVADPLWPAWPQPPAIADPPVPWIDGGPGEAPFAEVWQWERSRRPSYMYKLAESKRRQRLIRNFDAVYGIMQHNSKSDGYRLARRCGVGVPEVYIDDATIDVLDFGRLPDRAVVKTVSGSTNRGIYLLVRRGPDRFLDLMDSNEKSADEIIASYRDLVGRSLVSPRLIVEELLEPRPDVAHLIDIPDDLKVYCFDDRVVGLMQRRMNGTSDRTKWTFKFWTADWRDLGPVKYLDRLDRDLEPPSGGDEVLEAARRVARELAVPYVRLDLYDTARGPVFGEVSPHPGPPEVWRADIDELLGREWELAEARLMSRGRSVVEPPAP